MSAVLPLQTTCVVYIVRSLLDINDKHLRYREQAEQLKRCILQNSSNVIALELLLQYMTKHYPRAVTFQMLEFLVPFHLKTFDLTKCTVSLQLEGQYTSLLPRLSNVTSLIHTEGLLADPLPVSIAVEWASKLPHLTSVTLKECPGVTDRFVSIILFNVPNITHLNLARCSQISDAAFLNVSGQCPPKLTSLDVSGCSSLSSTAMRLLTELCGPSLRHIDVSLTNMDCTILWYLAGHSLASSVQLASKVRGKINNLADAISSQMNRLIHEFQFITEKLKEIGAREGAKNNDGDQGQSDTDDGNSGRTARDKDGVSESGGGSCGLAEAKDGVLQETDNVHAMKSSLSQETSSDIKKKREAINGDFGEEAGEENIETKYSSLHTDGMNEYLEQHNGEITSGVREGILEDENGSKEVNTGNKLLADSKNHVSSSENDSPLKSAITDSEINTSEDTIVYGNCRPGSESKGEFSNTCGKLGQGAREGDTGEDGMPKDRAHLQCDTGEPDGAQTTVWQLVGEVTDKPERGDFHEKDELVNLKSKEEWVKEEKESDSCDGMTTVKGISTDLKYTEECETDEQSKEPSNHKSFSEEELKSSAKTSSKSEKKDEDEVTVREKEAVEDEVKVEPCGHCLHNSSKAHVPTKLFEPHILSLNIDNIEFHADLIKSCFDEFFSSNHCLQSVTIANRAMTNELLQVVADNCTDLTSIRLLDSAKISSEGLAYLLEHCKNLKSLYLHGVPFLNNSAFVPLLKSDAALQTLYIAEVCITDGILHQLSKVVGHSLKELNLNWCEDITSQGILSMVENCPLLESFSIRQFQANESTLRSLARHCPKVKYLDLSGVEEMTDILLAEMMPRFRMLKVLDVSWTLNLTNDAVTAILCNCPLLMDLNLAGLKRITEKPFLPIISDISRWKRCQALIKLKLREQKVRESTGQDAMSSDEEYEDLYVPVRSTSYVPLLQRMDLQFCDLVKDSVLEEIVAVCCGSLEIIDYYGLEVHPKLLQL